MNKDLWDCNSDAIACQSIMIGKNGKAGFFASGLSDALDAIGQLISERGETVEPRPYVSVLLLNTHPLTVCRKSPMRAFLDSGSTCCTTIRCNPRVPRCGRERKEG